MNESCSHSVLNRMSMRVLTRSRSSSTVACLFVPSLNDIVFCFSTLCLAFGNYSRPLCFVDLSRPAASESISLSIISERNVS
jgi:hypothetical protein